MKFKYNKESHTLEIVETTKLEYAQVKLWLNRHVKGYRFTKPFKLGIWDGTVDHFHEGKAIPAGLYKECLKGLQEIGGSFDIINKHEFPIDRTIKQEEFIEFTSEFFKDHKFKNGNGELEPFNPRDYQIDTAFKILKNKYCLAQVATSGGKSLILSSIFFYYLRKVNPNAKILLIVPSITLVTQFYDDILDYNLGFQQENKNPIDIQIEEIMSDKPRKARDGYDPNITVACYQSIIKFDKEWFDKFEMIAIDESHICKTTSLTKILNKTMDTAKYRFGVSGTFADQKFADFYTIQSLTGPIVNDIKAMDLVEKGTITPMKIVQMHINHDVPAFETTLKNIRRNPNNAKKAYDLEREFIQNSNARLNFISGILTKVTANTLILFNSIEYGKKMMEQLEKDHPDKSFHFISGEVKNKNRKEIKIDMEQTDKIRVLIATYGTLSTGVSINALEYLILAESFKSEVRIIQSIGRILRLHTSKSVAKIIDIVDCYVENGTNAFSKHGNERINMYKNHNYPYEIKKFTLVNYK